MEQVSTLIDATGVAPDVVQRSWSPVDFDEKYLQYMQDKGIQISAHSPIRNVPMDNPILNEIASAHDTSVPQIILAWDLYHGVAVVPKSGHPRRMAENLAAASLHLEDVEIQAINAACAS